MTKLMIWKMLYNHEITQERICDDGISWIKQMDKKSVFFLSNYHDLCEVTVTNRTQKDGSAKTIKLYCPVMSSNYHKNIGYVDRSDHLVYELIKLIEN